MLTDPKTLGDRLLRAGISLITSAVTFLFISSVEIMPAGKGNWTLILFFSLLVFAAVYWLLGAIRDDLTVMLLIALLFGAGMIIRALCLNHITSDYADFLQKWVERFRVMGASAFSDRFSDYNMPYLYFLYFFSKLPLNDLYLIKALSIAFDVLNVVVAVRIALHFKLSVNRQMVVAAAVWLAPTMWLNSGFWGQCDSIYAFFILCAFYFILIRRPTLSVGAAALAFSFKLQAIFFLPIYLVFLIAKRVRWRDALAFPVVYVASVLPAMLMGKPLSQILSVYTTQVGLYDDRLNLNSPSVYALIPATAPHDVFFLMGILLAVVFLGVWFVMAWRGRERIDDATLMLFAFVFCAGIPWLLPSMHERYFYLADLFSIFVAVLIPRRFYVAPMVIYASYGGYHAYLFLQYLPFGGLAFPSLLVVTATGLISSDLYRRLFPATPALHPGEDLQPEEGIHAADAKERLS